MSRVSVVTVWLTWVSMAILSLMFVLSLFDLVVLAKQRSALIVWSLRLKALVLALAWVVLGILPRIPAFSHLGEPVPLFVFSTLAIPVGLSFIVLDCRAIKKQWDNRTGWHGI